MELSPYETVKTFELRTDLNTKLVVEISSRDEGERRRYRGRVKRVYRAGDGQERFSTWLGLRELLLMPGLVKMAAEWIEAQENKAAA